MNLKQPSISIESFSKQIDTKSHIQTYYYIIVCVSRSLRFSNFHKLYICFKSTFPFVHSVTVIAWVEHFSDYFSFSIFHSVSMFFMTITEMNCNSFCQLDTLFYQLERMHLMLSPKFCKWKLFTIIKIAAFSIQINQLWLNLNLEYYNIFITNSCGFPFRIFKWNNFDIEIWLEQG